MTLDAQQRALRIEDYRQPSGGAASGVDDAMQRIVEQIPLDPSMDVLDLAAGTGVFARAIARQVRTVTALAPTPGLADTGLRAGGVGDCSNISYVQAPAEELPFASDSFDLVVTRCSVHHVADPHPTFCEMQRVLRPNGIVVLIDLVADEDPEIAQLHNELERIADKCHTHILAPSAFIFELARAELRLIRFMSLDSDIDFDDWQSSLEPDSKEKREIRRALENELTGGRRTGMRPFLEGRKLKFKHTWGVFIVTNGIDALLTAS